MIHASENSIYHSHAAELKHLMAFLQDRNALMELVTNKSQEELVMRRVEKKAEVFGQEVTLDKNVAAAGANETAGSKYKVDPSVVYRLYEDWVIPFTKVVEVEYLLRRLD